jgi:ribosomal protein S18 acetylase RimI-like enzyme
VERHAAAEGRVTSTRGIDVPGISIFSARRDDIGSISELIDLAYRSEPRAFSMSPEEFATGIGAVRVDGASLWSVAAVDTAFIGCAQLVTRPESRLRHKAELRRVFVRREHRSRGVAEAMVQHLLASRPDHVGFVRLYVNAESHGAKRLYERLGFASYAVEPFAKMIAGDFVDEVVMQIDLRRSGIGSRSS